MFTRLKKAKKRKIKSTNVTYALIGLGRFGYALATELAAMNADFVVVDLDQEKINRIRDFTENAYVADATDPVALKKVGVHNCDIAIVCLAAKMDASILITLDLVNLGIPRVIAKAQSMEHGIILKKIGAEVVYPERDMALRLANRLENSKTLDYVRLSEKVNITKIRVTYRGNNKTILDLKIRQKYDCNVIAIERGNKVVESIDPKSPLLKGDIIYLTGTPEHLESLIKHI